MSNHLLGGLSAAAFLDKYWHKRPLLVRGAMPGFEGLATLAQLKKLAGRDEVESRFVLHPGNKRWLLRHGPFRAADFSSLPATRWTLLVQGLNLHLPAAAELLSKFSFIPHARLDDLMVSHAMRGGGVGPHFDSYDVFLLQGRGRRRWRISSQRDRTLIPGVPLKILRDFRPVREWVLEAGDMLYLPPGYAHDGTALDECQTYSIGFRAPAAQELAEHFLAWLQDHLTLAGRYADPDLKTQVHPGEIAPAMMKQLESMLARLRWSAGDAQRFLGEYLSTPKASIFFSVPGKPLSHGDFVRRARSRGIILDPGTLLLFAARNVFINGESISAPAAARRILVALADARMLPPATLLAPAADLIYHWYRLGYLHLAEGRRNGATH